MTGLKLSVLTLAISGLELMAIPDIWFKLGVAGMAVLGLIYVYKDMRRVHKEKETVLLQYIETVKKITSEHKDDIKDLVKDQAETATAVAKLAVETATKSNEIMRDSVQVMTEVKEVIKANTIALVQKK
ncbi:hypothetical protein ACFLQL_00090 [Verrucomicrobiota bacterium]